MLIVAHYSKCAPNSIEHGQFLFVQFFVLILLHGWQKNNSNPIFVDLFKDQILDQIKSTYQYFAMFGAMEMCVTLQYIALLFIFYIPPV